MDELLPAVRYPFWRDHMPLLPAFKPASPFNPMFVGIPCRSNSVARAKDSRCHLNALVCLKFEVFTFFRFYREPLFKSNYFQTVRRCAPSVVTLNILRVPVSEVVALDFGPLPDYSISINGLFDASRALQLRSGSYIRRWSEMLPAYNYEPDPISVAAVKWSASTSGTPSTCFVALQVSTRFFAISRPDHFIPGHWYLNAVSSGSSACSSAYLSVSWESFSFLLIQTKGHLAFVISNLTGAF
ncbi:hypothetical protein B0H19DRAFT_1334461 [Mycena capillaripes]|nr:hypothetical protein B0H19DRAFT_1334461 [Mycena capillaripes]